MKEKNVIKKFFYRHRLTKYIKYLCYNYAMGAIYVILDLLIRINKNKLNKMIEHNYDYEIILRQSQKLDVYIMQKTIKMINKRNKPPKRDAVI